MIYINVSIFLKKLNNLYKEKLLKLYKSEDLDEDDRKMLVEFEKKLRLIFKQVDEIDRDVEVMAKRKRMSDKKN